MTTDPNTADWQARNRERDINELVAWMREDGYGLVDDFGVDHAEKVRLSLWQAFRGETRPIEDLWLHRLPDFDETLWIED